MKYGVYGLTYVRHKYTIKLSKRPNGEVSIAGIEMENSITSPTTAYDLLKSRARGRQERFIVITLNGAHEPIRTRVVTVGLVNRTLVHPREVFYPAIKDNAVAIIVAHNHPSGRTDPSAEDNEVTTRLVAAGKLIGIDVLDHLVIGKAGFFSYADHGRI